FLIIYYLGVATVRYTEIDEKEALKSSCIVQGLEYHAQNMVVFQLPKEYPTRFN
ncbi:hypothetical protein BDZ89DRAFT_1060246, partial [Hymenopellis radicata]